MGSEHISYYRYGSFSVWIIIRNLNYLELPSDFQTIQEEIERQKAASLDKTKRRETVDFTGKDF
jgi:hypothetical protein